MENVINSAAESVSGKSLKDHKWSFPMAVALKATGGILTGLSSVGGIPVVGVIGSALQMGASLFEKDIHDYQKETETHFEKLDTTIKESNDWTRSQVQNMSLTIESSTEDILVYTKNVEKQIVQGTNTILENVEEIQKNLKEQFVLVKSQLNEINPKFEELKKSTSAILDILADSQYRNGIERVEAAFDTFVDMADSDLNEAMDLLKNFMFELKTDMRQHLRNEKLAKYLVHIMNEKGPEEAKQMFSYIVTVRGKYLFIMAVYAVFHRKYEAIASEFNSFNKDVQILTEQFFVLCPSQFLIENSIKLCGYEYTKAYRIKCHQLVWPVTGEKLSLKQAFARNLITKGFYDDSIKQAKPKEVNVKATAWQIMMVHPEQNTLIPLVDSNSGNMSFELSDQIELDKIFPSDGYPCYPKTGTNILKSTALMLAEENSRLKQKVVELQNQYEENEKHVKKTIDTLEQKVSLHEFQKRHSNLGQNSSDLPDYSITKTLNINDSRLSHKPLSMAEIVDTVVELKRTLNSWSAISKSKDIKLTEGNMCAKNTSGLNSGLLKAAQPMIPTPFETAYYEVNIKSSGEGWIGIGLATDCVSTENNYPGRAQHSYGYYSYDGDKRCNMGSLTKYGPNYSHNDVIGCGLSDDRLCFFTLNGNNLGVAFKVDEEDFANGLYPCVGFYNAGYRIADLWEVTANFGHESFLFDINSLE